MSVTPVASARFKLGLVVGKFAPLHLGHEWLVQQAAARCDRLLILSYTSPEFAGCEPEKRSHWLRQRCPGHEVHVFDQASLDQACHMSGVPTRTLPPNTSADSAHQEFLAWLLRMVVQRQPDAFFCSESYGPSCAGVLSEAFGREVVSVVLDPERRNFPCRASLIRNDVESCRSWLAPEVRASFVKRIAIVGGESSGKTTLARELAERCATNWVAEYGRELWELRAGALSEQDLIEIAREQIRREEAATVHSRKYLFCDTSPLTTAGYNLWMFGNIQTELQALSARRYDGVILCEPDFPFVQDGTRRDDTFRMKQHEWYQAKMKSLSMPVLTVHGDVQSRLAEVERWLGSLPGNNQDQFPLI